MEKALVVDDGFLMRGFAVESLRKGGIYVDEASSSEEAIKNLASRSYDFIFVDVGMLASLKSRIDRVPGALLIVTTSFASVDRAIEWVKQGAYDYIVKPFSPEQITLVLIRARELIQLKSQTRASRQEEFTATVSQSVLHYAGSSSAVQKTETSNLQEIERQTILRVFDETGGHRNVMAEILGISVRTLRNKLNQYRGEGCECL